MINKILWSICVFLLVLGSILIFKSYSGGNLTTKYIKINNELINNFDNKIFALHRKPYKNDNAGDPDIDAKSIYLLDADSSTPLYSLNENEILPIASTTKIMTALVVLENYKDRMNDEVVITSKMTNVAGTDIELRNGEIMTVENLLNGLLIMSGNDTAFALANHFGGKEYFVQEMNKKAKIIGLNNTEYLDPAGLDDDGHSTAKELAIIASYAMKNSKFSEIVKTPAKTIYSTNGRIAHELKNSNRMMREEEQYFYPYAIGIKTGFTTPAGHVLVGAASKDSHTIISVVLNTDENTLVASAKESRKLLDWGFNSYTW